MAVNNKINQPTKQNKTTKKPKPQQIKSTYQAHFFNKSLYCADILDISLDH